MYFAEGETSVRIISELPGKIRIIVVGGERKYLPLMLKVECLIVVENIFIRRQIVQSSAGYLFHCFFNFGMYKLFKRITYSLQLSFFDVLSFVGSRLYFRKCLMVNSRGTLHLTVSKGIC